MNNSPPPAPDPYQTAAAQGNSNIQTAVAQGQLSPNTVGPTGSTTVSRSGDFQTIRMPDGTTQQVERPTVTTSLSSGEQGLYDQGVANRGKMNTLASTQLDTLGGVLGKRLDLSGTGVDPNSFSADRARVEQSMRDRLAPANQRRLEAEQTRLTNMGHQQGTAGWREGLDDYNRGINDQELGIIERGLGEQQGLYGMASNAANFQRENTLLERNQPINETGALMSGGQVMMPTATPYQGGQVAPTDVSGNVYNSAALQQQQYQQKLAQQNAMIGGVAGMFGAGLGMPPVQKKLWG
jgi:hypothetical protein